ncbi:UNVERIFIED_CONTAM: hypothetical protein Sradi_7038600 [Sesamum radiatum]|uniref:Uncharacterized protein n=1 Tax=Sesamum radiatum TaxID=300843 RepID=A0AAW2J9E4_SESRA
MIRTKASREKGPRASLARPKDIRGRTKDDRKAARGPPEGAKIRSITNFSQRNAIWTTTWSNSSYLEGAGQSDPLVTHPPTEGLSSAQK